MHLSISNSIACLLLLLTLGNKSIAQKKVSEEKQETHFDISLLVGLEGFQGRASMNEALSQNNFMRLSDYKPLSIGFEINVTNKRNVFKTSMWYSALDSVEGNAMSNLSKFLFTASYGYDLIPRSNLYLFPFAGPALSVTKMDCVSKNGQFLMAKKIDLLFQSGIGLKIRSTPENPRNSFIPTFGLYVGTFLPIAKGSWNTSGTSPSILSGRMESRFHRFLIITAGFSF